VKERTIIAVTALAGCFGLQAYCLFLIGQGVDSAITGIFATVGNIAAIIVGFYFGRKEE